MKKYVQTPTNLYCTFCKSVGHDDRDCRVMTSCMKGQETYTKFKAKYNKKETLRSTTPLGEETSILMVDSEDEDEEEVWVEAEDRSFVTTAHNQDT
jgi:hypothetical protein